MTGNSSSTIMFFWNSMKTATNGLFSVFSMVLGVLEFYEEGGYGGLKVDIKDQGFYYDPEYGLNWWQYYFEPINLGEEGGKKVLVFTYQDQAELAFQALELSRKLLNSLINKYIHLRPHVQEKFNTLQKRYLNDAHMIGVHYRGTDKRYEAPRVPYERVVQEISNYMDTHSELRPFKIFVATDEQAFLDYMIAQFPEQVVFLEDCIRSLDNKAVHYNCNQNYKKGEDAVFDCLLLSRCHVLIRTSSNLSWASMCFNPDIPAIDLNQANLNSYATYISNYPTKNGFLLHGKKEKD